MKKDNTVTQKELEHKELFTPTNLRDGSKRNRNNKIKIALFSILVVLIIIASTLLVLYFKEPRGPEIEVPEDTYSLKISEIATQYYNDNSNDFNKNTTLYIKEGKVYALIDEYNEVEVNVPLYMENGNEVYISEKMLQYTPRVKGWPNKLDPLTKISRNNNGSLVVSRNDKSAAINRGFLYDCNDFYFFLEPMKININNKYTVEVGQFSYAEVVVNGKVSIFNHNDKMWYSYDCEGVCTATPINEDPTLPVDYTLNLVADSFLDYSGVSNLLFMDADIIEEALV